MEELTFQELTNEIMRLYPEGKYAEALEVVEQNADRFPVQLARTTFWRMCLLSLSGRPDDVISVFRQGLDSGLWWAENLFAIETDFDPVRDLPEFKRLVAESNQKCIEMQAHVKPDRTVLLPDDMSGELPFLIALHGRNGNKDSNLEYWDVARRRGWLVLSPQSRQTLFEGSHCWDDSHQGLRDILFHVEEIMQTYRIDKKRILIGGFSQGSGLGIYMALTGRTGARGFIGVGTFIAQPDSLLPLAGQQPALRGYFFTGEKDHTLDKARAIQKILRENNIPFGEEVFPELGHAFPPEFQSSFDTAIQFILE